MPPRSSPVTPFRSRAGWAASALIGSALALLIPLTCSDPESDGLAAARETAVPADSTLAARFVAGVQGADPVDCGLAARALDQGWWSSDPRVDPAAGDPQSREVVGWATGRREDPGGVPVLAAALSGSDPCARRLAARVLGRIRAPQAAAALQQALGSADPEEREAAAVGLGYAESEDAIPALVEALGDGEASVRIAAAWALGQIESPAAIEPLVRTLAGDEAAPVREAAAWALGEIE